MMKKITCLFLSVSIIFLSCSQTMASKLNTENKIIYNDNNISIMMLEDNDEYQKIQVKDRLNDKVEYVESYYQSDGTFIYKVTSDENEYIVKNNGEEIIISNQDNVVIDTIELIDEELEIDGYNTINAVKNGPWKATNMKGYTSKSQTISDAGMMVSVIASICSLSPGTAIVGTIASWYYARRVSNIYYYFEVQTRIYNGWQQRRNYTRFYTNSSYSTVVRSTFSPAKNYHRIY